MTAEAPNLANVLDKIQFHTV